MDLGVPILVCLNTGTHKNHLFGTNGKLMVLGVPIFKQIKVGFDDNSGKFFICLIVYLCCELSLVLCCQSSSNGQISYIFCEWLNIHPNLELCVSVLFK